MSAGKVISTIAELESAAECTCAHPRGTHATGGGCGVRGCMCMSFTALRHDAQRASDDASASTDVATRASEERAPEAKLSAPAPARRRLSDERSSVTRSFRLAYTHKDGSPDVMHLYFTASTYSDGTVGEVFIKADKTGTLASGALDSLAVMVSLLLQHGVPLEVVCAKLRHTRFPPAGFTKDPAHPSCTSPLDLLAQWLLSKFGSPDVR